METGNRGDLTINGFGAFNGGEFNRVVLNGKGTVNSDIDCENFECKGNGFVNGNLRATAALISGKGRVMGDVNTKILSVEGKGQIEKNTTAKKVKISGNTTIGGSLQSDEVRARGRLTVGEDCEAEVFKAECQFSIGGLLNAEQVDVRIYGECKANEIGGQHIKIKAKQSLMSHLFKPFFQNTLDVHVIEGDQIEIENTNAKIVRGNHVKVGPNCNIGLVEYTDKLTKDKKAIVNDSRQV